MNIIHYLQCFYNVSSSVIHHTVKLRTEITGVTFMHSLVDDTYAVIVVPLVPTLDQVSVICELESRPNMRLIFLASFNNSSFVMAGRRSDHLSLIQHWIKNELNPDLK